MIQQCFQYLAGTTLSLFKNYGVDGSFELKRWEEVFGKNNIITTYEEKDGCYYLYYDLTFKPNGDFIDKCGDRAGEHIFSITGESEGEFKGELNFVAWFLVADEKYRGGVCKLSKVSTQKENSSDLKLTCTVEAVKSLQFFNTLPGDKKADTFVWIYPSERFELKESFSSFIKLSALLLLSLLF